MEIEIKIPALSDTMKSGRITKWYVEEGQYVEKDSCLCDIAVNKVNFEVYSDYEGIISKIVCPAGSTVEPGDVIAIVTQSEEVKPSATQKEIKYEYKEYDLAVIGAGPGGYVAAIKAAKKGAKVALFEKDKLGGTCLNRGCIPTKAYARIAEVYDILKRSGEFGFDVKVNSFDYAKIVKRKNDIVGELTEGINALLKANGVDLFYAEAKVDKEKNVLFGENKIKAKNIIIATGSSPAELPIEGINSKNVMNSDVILEITSLPQSLCIIGGGVIGMEFAFIMNQFGVKVSVVEMMPDILPILDKEVSSFIRAVAQRRGIKIYTSSTVERIDEEENGGSIVTVKNGENIKRIYADKVFVSIGRKLNTDIGPIVELLDFEGKAIKVDEYMRTNVEGVYAVGDVTGKMMLAHVASAQGEVAVDNIFGESNTLDYMKIPAAVFTEPEIGYFGYTEEEARKKFKDIKVGRFNFEHNGRAKTYGETEGFAKVISNEKGEVVGVWVVGSGASELIHILSTACQEGVDAEALKKAVYAHPTRSETIMEAVKDIFGESVHKV
ncbi:MULTISPECIES: dihydrolipoyl dehydrogenase [Thermoanaerobacter]|uniref:Dihydrolipoyl dehydrogenase n=2 Tax=Thermoanaerobacter TaxID=1754 RepID=B0KD93_THEP3|nr:MULTISPECIES: dihydrolipoyl dehydrogenase [Thermoanaerobacter]ABY95612.1 dihydrolipoamide dehydrogenase [Thermoanaerobacter pseudethanolicus ATCC 33223]ADV80550.1 dihydrolipoamide dehydrogenase [Thermoanaerobacter brockii subsp. finnii Ako-1]HBW60295.1 dihydrolipoyl dehydrogenase [Thermoanaerobacter sp.]